MHKKINPQIAAPGPTYSHAVEIHAATRQLHVSGQVGVDVSGVAGRGALEQSRLAFANLAEILAASQMTIDHLARIRCYLVNEADVEAFKEARAEFLKGRRPASSLLVVKALADPAWLVEVEAIAAC